MKASEPDETGAAWDRLAGWHRIAAAGRDETAPLGFATRVVARWADARRVEIQASWERLSVRTALGCAALALVVTGIATPWDSWRSGGEDLILLPVPDLTEGELLYP